MGHADIQTTMIYIHHVPQHDAADRLSALLEERNLGARRCTPGAQGPSAPTPEVPETNDLQEIRDAGGGTRTPDTRIMIAGMMGEPAYPSASQGLLVSDT